jgi:hypothetical protein
MFYMILLIEPGAELDAAPYRQMGCVVARHTADSYTLRRKPIYPKGFSALAREIWRHEPLQTRKQWKPVVARALKLPDGTLPTWAHVQRYYRGVLYRKLTRGETLTAQAPQRLTATVLSPPAKQSRRQTHLLCETIRTAMREILAARTKLRTEARPPEVTASLPSKRVPRRRCIRPGRPKTPTRAIRCVRLATRTQPEMRGHDRTSARNNILHASPATGRTNDTLPPVHRRWHRSKGRSSPAIFIIDRATSRHLHIMDP